MRKPHSLFYTAYQDMVSTFPRSLLRLATACCCALLLHGCFTGVESTPKITYSDVKRENIPVTAEQNFLQDIAPEAPARWQPGKLFRVTDPKISLIFSAASTAPREGLTGQDLVFAEFRPMQGVDGEVMAEAVFSAPGGILVYPTDIPYAEIGERSRLEIPFTIEMDLVEAASQRIAGRRCYVVTPMWYDADGTTTVQGLRHVPVDITAVVPGNQLYPLRVVFHESGKEGAPLHSMYMTLGSGRTSTRNFDRLFSFDNPRERYPRITDDVWDLIIHSRIKEGMSRDECRLALGSPQTVGQRPTTAGMVEYWQYPDGIYLIFEEDYLTLFRK